MPWIAPLIGAGVGLLGGGNSQGGTQTVSKDPWSVAAPWLTQQVQRGQQLQGQYEAQPFNALQTAAYGNLFKGNDYVNQMVPGLLAQFGQQNGFDRSNPQARPSPYLFGTQAQMPQMQPTAGLLGQSMQQAQAAPAQAPFDIEALRRQLGNGAPMYDVGAGG